MLKKRILFALIAVLISFSVIIAFYSVLKSHQAPQATTPVPNESQVDFDAYTPKATVRLKFNSANHGSSSPTHTINSFSAPRRLEFTLYNVHNPDLNSIIDEFKEFYFVKDAYRTIVLDDSIARFTVELNTDVSYTSSEYTGEYIDIEFSPTQTNDNTVYIIRSSSSKMNEGLAQLCESVFNLNPSIVKTSDSNFCVTFNHFSTYEAANEFLSDISDKRFYIEKTTVFSNPE